MLGRKSLAAGHRIVQVYSRHADHANVLAIRLGTNSTSYISSVERKTDLMIVALRDEAVAYLVKEIGEVRNRLWYIRPALFRSMKSADRTNLLELFIHCKVCEKKLKSLPVLSMLINGNNNETTSLLKEYALSIAGSVAEANDEDQSKISSGRDHCK